MDLKSKEELEKLKAPALIALYIDLASAFTGLQDEAKTKAEEHAKATESMQSQIDTAAALGSDVQRKLDVATADLEGAQEALREAEEGRRSAEQKLAASGNVTEILDEAERVYKLHQEAEAAAEASDKAASAARAGLARLFSLKKR